MSDLFGPEPASKPKKAKAQRTHKAREDATPGYSTSPDKGMNPDEPCPHCFGREFWRLRDGVGYVVCARCHPPLVDAGRVEEVGPKKS